MNIEVVNYSEKAIAVFGAVSETEQRLIEAKGLFNASLKAKGEQKAGWIFSKKHREKAEEIAKDLGWDIAEYSEKSMVVWPNELETHTKVMVEQRGIFNPKLKYGDDKKAGWVFSKKNEEALKDALKTIKAA